ncbi:MAG TPA: 4-hydroxy-tetrahydrodipicolinate synthase [Fimbriimonadaceae bacterium]|nr:4-hydroxy-tetrahydrodipicolinate synthase [Fimbriimonadaceae bacterium]
MGAFSGPKEWGRLLTAMITPFNAAGGVDYDEAARLASHLVDHQKNDGLIICGTTGEAPTLTHEEKLRLLEVSLEAVGDRAAIVFGAGTYNTAESIEMSRAAEKRGAHGILAVNPYYNRPGQEGLEAHFRAMAGATGLPVMLYNIQPRSSINLETPTLLRLAEVPNIVAVKEASGMIGQIGDVCRLAPEGFRVYSGDDGLTLPILSLGGHGLVSVVAHVVGAELAEMIAVFERDPVRSRAIHRRLSDCFKVMFANPSPVPIKYAVSLVGLGSEAVRLPLVTLNDQAKAGVKKVLASLGKLAAAAV